MALKSDEVRAGMEQGALLAIARDGYYYLLTPELCDGRSIHAMRQAGEVDRMAVTDLQRTWLQFFGHKTWEDNGEDGQ